MSRPKARLLRSIEFWKHVTIRYTELKRIITRCKPRCPIHPFILWLIIYIPLLIIEGSGRELDQIRIRREALQGALISVSLILGIPVLRSQHPEETAQLILMANRQVETAASGAIQRHGYRPKGKSRRQLFVLQSLPGIGPKRASLLLDRFGSVTEVITASAEQLAAVDSIGKQTAENIKWAVEERVSLFGNIRSATPR